MKEKIRNILKQTIVGIVVSIFVAMKAILTIAQKALVATLGLPKSLNEKLRKES